MAREQIEVNGVMVDLRNTQELIEGIDQVLGCKEAYNADQPETPRELSTEEQATLSFFGSIKHHLKGGIENEW